MTDLPSIPQPSLHGDWLQAPLYQGDTSSGHLSNGSNNLYPEQNQYEVSTRS